MPRAAISNQISENQLHFNPQYPFYSPADFTHLHPFQPYPSMNAENNHWHDVKTRFKIGQEVEGRVVHKAPFGDFVDIGAGFPTLLEIIQMPEPPPGLSLGDVNPVGASVKARIASFEETPEKQIRLTQKP